jgi:hypothetical protein
MLKEYESVTKKDLFRKAVLAAFLFGRKYDVLPQNGDCSRQSNVPTSVFRNEVRCKTQRRYRTQYGKAPPADIAIRCWLKQFQKTGSVLH